jgi:hypothetical protein
MYVGQGMVIQAPQTGEDIEVTRFKGYWQQNVVAVRRGRLIVICRALVGSPDGLPFDQAASSAGSGGTLPRSWRTRSTIGPGSWVSSWAR